MTPVLGDFNLIRSLYYTLAQSDWPPHSAEKNRFVSITLCSRHTRTLSPTEIIMDYAITILVITLTCWTLVSIAQKLRMWCFSGSHDEDHIQSWKLQTDLYLSVYGANGQCINIKMATLPSAMSNMSSVLLRDLPIQITGIIRPIVSVGWSNLDIQFSGQMLNIDLPVHIPVPWGQWSNGHAWSMSRAMGVLFLTDTRDVQPTLLVDPLTLRWVKLHYHSLVVPKSPENMPVFEVL